ncbi:MAG: hypothetical protein ACLFVW_01545 [Phycisphaerae bacterium]
MAIPTGTTAKQLSLPARLLPAAVVVLGVLTWWWPGYRAWGAMSAGLILSLTLWVLWQVLEGRRSVRGHAFHWALLPPAAVALYHLLRLSWDASAVTADLGGAMSVTMLYQLALLAAGVMLIQSAFSSPPAPTLPAAVFSLALCLGAAAGAAWAPEALSRDPMALLACAGAVATVGTLAPLARRQSPASTESWSTKAVLIGSGVLVVSVCVLAVRASTVALPVTAAVAGACLLVSLARGRLMRAGVIVAVGMAGLALAMWVVVEAVGSDYPSAVLLGTGEAGLLDSSVATPGLEVLSSWTGRPAMLCLLLAASLATLWPLLRLPATATERVRAGCWAAGSALSLAALFSAGGFFIPAVTPAVAMFWGLLPAMCGVASPSRSGGWVLAVLLGLMLMLGLSQSSGLVGWSAAALGGSDRTLHAVTGFLLALVLVWLMGARSVWWGVVGVLLAMVAGGVGEVLQSFVPQRGAPPETWLAVIAGSAGEDGRKLVANQLDDVVFHALGSAAVLILYLPAMGAKWCESADVDGVAVNAAAKASRRADGDGPLSNR